MNSDEESRNSNAEAELEREIRQRRKFTAQEAIGRLAGSGAMSGGSVVSRQQEAENEIACWIGSHVDDPTGALHVVLNRQIKGSELLLGNIDRPLLALRIHCDRLMASDHLLKEFVREVDVEWGRAMEERPYFERDGSMPDPNDPYTVESVRCTLSTAIKRLDL